MTQPIAARKQIELDRKFKSLEEEFDHWLFLSKKDGPFEKHHTQILAVKGMLDRLHAGTREELKAAAGDAILAIAQNAEMMILAVYRIWEYFRAKFAQRNEERFVKYLKAADEFAWACYRPAQMAAQKTAPKLKFREPPLVFFNGGASPYAISRNREFEAELIPDEKLTKQEYLDILNSLPIPVIGVPWFQIAHLPDALLLGHEVGHTVEDDFGLTDRLKEILQETLDQNVDAKRHAAWHAWLGECFADLYGGLATGPAYVGALMDFLASDPAGICNESLPRLTKNNMLIWDIYPTNALRILFNLEALRGAFEEERKQMEEEWLASYPQHQMPEFVDDVRAIVPALLDGKFPQLGNRNVKEILNFSAKQQKEAKETVRQLKESEELTSETMRTLFAAARMAYQGNAAAYVTKEYAEELLNHMQAILKPGTRADESEPDEATLHALSARQEAAGDRLFQQLWSRFNASAQTP